MEVGALRTGGTLHTLRLTVECMRPRQWIKNAFVFGGVLFSGQFVEIGRSRPRSRCSSPSASRAAPPTW